MFLLIEQSRQRFTVERRNIASKTLNISDLRLDLWSSVLDGDVTYEGGIHMRSVSSEFT